MRLMHRRNPLFGLLIALAAGVWPLAAPQPRTLDLLTASIADIQAAVEGGGMTYERLVQMYLNRIGAYDKAGPVLNAVIAINPRALDIARARDEERRKTGRRGPLHGIPIAIKDNIDTTAMPTTGGNPVFAAVGPARDATVVARLERAGAIIFLKTNLDELAMSSQGLSTVGGQTLNPYDLARSPGGSSGGTAVAVSAGFAAAGLATETGLSIRGPAANTGLVAIAPSRGLVSRAGVIPISFTQDRVGVHARRWPMRRSCSPDPRLRRRGSHHRREPRARRGFAVSVDLTMTLEGMRVGVLGNLFRDGADFAAGNALDPAADRATPPRVARRSSMGCGPDTISSGHDADTSAQQLRAAPAFDAYLQRRGSSAPVKTLAEFIARGKHLRGGNMEVRFAETMKVDVLDSDNEYRQRLATRARSPRAPYRADGCAQSGRPRLSGEVARRAAGRARLTRGPRDNPISSVTGLPAVVVPVGCGSATACRSAMEILGLPFSERALLTIAQVYERLRGPRVLPKTAPLLPGDSFRY